MVGLSRDNIASYERGTEPNVDVIHKLVNIFNISFNDLIDRDLSNSGFPIETDKKNDEVKEDSLPYGCNSKSKKAEVDVSVLEGMITSLTSIVNSQEATIAFLIKELDQERSKKNT